uniref:TLE family member 5, transcriptional modulator n=1 Tax=Sus scrofa TaxID=9823 RepID=A0A8D1RB22_PIG
MGTQATAGALMLPEASPAEPPPRTWTLFLVWVSLPFHSLQPASPSLSPAFPSGCLLISSLSASLSFRSSPHPLSLEPPYPSPAPISLSLSPPTQYYEMSYGLNIEMHKQAEIVKRLNGICAQVLPYLSQEHQQQVLGAIERAKQVTAPELNSIIRQQLQAHQLSQLQALALPLTPLPVGLQPPSLPAVSAGTGLLSLSALGSQAHLSKEDKNGHDGDTHQEDDGEKSD